MRVGIAALLCLATVLARAEILADGVAAIVGEEVILISEVHARAHQLQLQMAAQGPNAPTPEGDRLLRMALDALVDEALVRKEAQAMEVSVEDEEVDRAVETMAQQNGLSSEQFAAALSSMGMTMEAYRRSIRNDLLRMKVLNLRVRSRVAVSEETARAYYNDQVREVRQDAWFEGAHILVRVPADARTVDVAKARQRALEIKRRIEEGEPFDQVAREVSEDGATAPHGGRLGRRMPGELPAIIERAFLDMEPGEVAGPVRTSAGFHILYLVDREDVGVQPFAQVKDQLLAQLSNREMDRQQRLWLAELRKKTYIDIRYP